MRGIRSVAVTAVICSERRVFFINALDINQCGVLTRSNSHGVDTLLAIWCHVALDKRTKFERNCCLCTMEVTRNAQLSAVMEVQTHTPRTEMNEVDELHMHAI